MMQYIGVRLFPSKRLFSINSNNLYEPSSSHIFPALTFIIMDDYKLNRIDALELLWKNSLSLTLTTFYMRKLKHGERFSFLCVSVCLCVCVCRCLCRLHQCALLFCSSSHFQINYSLLFYWKLRRHSRSIVSHPLCHCKLMRCASIVYLVTHFGSPTSKYFDHAPENHETPTI